MKNNYRITFINYNKLKNLPLSDSVKATGTFYKTGFAEVVKWLGGRPFRQRNGWSAMRGDIEYIIQRI